MGLDMYLTKRIYVGAYYEFNKVEGHIDIRTNGKQIPVDFKKVSCIEERVGYWRKANAIHKWFVDNVQDGVDDCKEYYVSREKLNELLELCRKVKRIAKLKEGKIETGVTYKSNGEVIQNYTEGKIIENADEIAKLLPTQEGFFFGGTGYDEYYLEDIDNTINIIEEIKRQDDNGFRNDYYYSSSW